MMRTVDDRVKCADGDVPHGSADGATDPTEQPTHHLTRTGQPEQRRPRQRRLERKQHQRGRENRNANH